MLYEAIDWVDFYSLSRHNILLTVYSFLPEFEILKHLAICILLNFRKFYLTGSKSFKLDMIASKQYSMFSLFIDCKKIESSKFVLFFSAIFCTDTKDF